MTPDLRARFVMGATTNRPVGTTGGEESVALDLGQMPDHQHTYSAPMGDPVQGAASETIGANPLKAGTETWNIGGCGGSWGNTRPHENRPPYYAVYYIMRVE